MQLTVAESDAMWHQMCCVRVWRILFGIEDAWAAQIGMSSAVDDDRRRRRQRRRQAVRPETRDGIVVTVRAEVVSKKRRKRRKTFGAQTDIAQPQCFRGAEECAIMPSKLAFIFDLRLHCSGNGKHAGSRNRSGCSLDASRTDACWITRSDCFCFEYLREVCI